MPIRSLRGSDLMQQIEERTGSDVATITDPFTGESWLALKPLLPDVAVTQVQTADEEGNAWIMGPRWDNVEQAKASQRTIVIAEQVVSSDVIRQNPEWTVIPGLLVSHVVELPFAAHPTSVYRVYDYDAEQIESYVEATRTPESFRAFLDEVVYGVKDHWEYLEKVGGMRRLNNLRADLILGY
jgi:glutaconate CoA-transferase subunit A